MDTEGGVGVVCVWEERRRREEGGERGEGGSGSLFLVLYDPPPSGNVATENLQNVDVSLRSVRLKCLAPAWRIVSDNNSTRSHVWDCVCVARLPTTFMFRTLSDLQICETNHCPAPLFHRESCPKVIFWQYTDTCLENMESIELGWALWDQSPESGQCRTRPAVPARSENITHSVQQSTSCYRRRLELVGSRGHDSALPFSRNRSTNLG